ncbi:MlaD family protein [Oceanomicrobium pacificus]|uniref:MCE family protein n=1 Tax=Oceanomicrobium pacificus TaxID=2692916 RepID=A0A6B0TNG2_9RHOB|nr:MlaD family protein [Oceanomicrobium pacificus]MXU66087.1 MCE family protein [Oceanomicrobium pacificus]
MTETPDPGTLKVERGKTAFLDRISLIWLVPIIALAGSLLVAWEAYSERGVLITISFEDASGIEAGHTLVKYRDVEVGHVTDMEFAEDLNSVDVSVRVHESIASYLDAESQFWVVRPNVSSSGISGLETVLTGVYIEGSWDSEKGTAVRSFKGLEERPLVLRGTQGTRINLYATNAGSLSPGAPITYKGLTVGQIDSVDLTRFGDGVDVSGFINAPYDSFVTSGSRFWDISGFSFTLGAEGARLNVESLASLVQGGIAFDTVLSDTRPLSEDVIFDIFSNEDAARASIFDADKAEQVTLSIVFEGSVNGLQVGAPVDYRGLRVGEVIALSARIDREDRNNPQVQLVTNIVLRPTRLGLPAGTTAEGTLDFLQGLVDEGLRAQLATEGLLARSLKVTLLEVEDALPATIDTDADPFPLFPSVPAELGSFANSAESVLERVGNLPLEELLNNAINLMAGLENLIGQEDTQQVPGAVTGLLADLRGLVQSDDVQSVPVELNASLVSLRSIIDRIEQSSAVDNLLAALENVDTAADRVTRASERLPDLLDNLNNVASKANDLPLEELIASANTVLDDLDAIVGAAETQAIPAELEASLVALRSIVEDIDNNGTAETLSTALVNANDAAANIALASDDLPVLIDKIGAVADKANDLPLEDLVTELTDLVETADVLIGSDDTARLPGALSDALDQLRSILDALEEGGAVENLNSTLASAGNAADEVALAAQSLPDLVDRLNALADTAEATLAAYGAGAPLNREAVAAIRDIRETARSVTSLANTLERKPNAIILGR